MSENSLSNKVGMPQDVKLNTAKNSVVVNGRTTTESYSVKSRGTTHTVVQSSTEPSALSKVGILGLILAVILIVSIVRSLYGSSPITFGGLLEYLSNAPVVDLTMKSIFSIPPIAWEGNILGPIATFLNFFIDIWNVSFWIYRALWQCIQYIGYFLMFIFN